MKIKSIVIYILLVLCVLSAIGMILALTFPSQEQVEFVPPEFALDVKTGTPTVSQELGWYEIYQDGMEYSAYVCGNIILDNNSADVYFYNTAENKVWLKLRIYSLDGTVLAETGLIKPNEYVETISFDKLPLDGDKVKMKIMAYEPETYYSKGSVVLNTTVKIGG